MMYDTTYQVPVGTGAVFIQFMLQCYNASVAYAATLTDSKPKTNKHCKALRVHNC